LLPDLLEYVTPRRFRRALKQHLSDCAGKHRVYTPAHVRALVHPPSRVPQNAGQQFALARA
jgi:hypothetical protein